MTFTLREGDDDKLHPADRDSLAPPLHSFLQCGQPGVFVAFCYSFRMEAEDEAYRDWVRELAAATSVPTAVVRFADICGDELGYSHVAGLISCDANLLDRVLTEWKRVRDYPIE